MMPSVVYQISNTVNDKKYIGIALDGDYERRFQAHLRDARLSRNNWIIHNAIRKYGEEQFSIEPLEYFEDEIECRYRETELIKSYSLDPKGYNMVTSMYPMPEVCPYSPEIRERISKGAKRAWAEIPLEEARKRKERLKKNSNKFWKNASEQEKKNTISTLNQSWKDKWESLSEEDKNRRDRKASLGQLKLNPNLNRLLRLGEKKPKTISGGPGEKVFSLFQENRKFSYEELSKLLAHLYPTSTPCVNPNGLESYWRKQIKGALNQGYLEFEDGQPYIQARR